MLTPSVVFWVIVTSSGVAPKTDAMAPRVALALLNLPLEHGFGRRTFSEFELDPIVLSLRYSLGDGPGPAGVEVMMSKHGRGVRAEGCKGVIWHSQSIRGEDPNPTRDGGPRPGLLVQCCGTLGEQEKSLWNAKVNTSPLQGRGCESRLRNTKLREGTRANTLRDTGLPIIVITTVGRKTGKIRKVALMRVEHEGEYAVIASQGGAPEDPPWVYNLQADPNIALQDGPEPFEAVVRLVEGDERAQWWERAVEAFPPYSEYQAKTERVIPVFIASAKG